MPVGSIVGFAALKCIEHDAEHKAIGARAAYKLLSVCVLWISLLTHSTADIFLDGLRDQQGFYRRLPQLELSRYVLFHGLQDLTRGHQVGSYRGFGKEKQDEYHPHRVG